MIHHVLFVGKISTLKMGRHRLFEGVERTRRRLDATALQSTL